MPVRPPIQRLVAVALVTALSLLTAGPALAELAATRPCQTMGASDHCSRGPVLAACCCDESAPATPVTPQLQLKDGTGVAFHEAAPVGTVTTDLIAFRLDAPRHGYHSVDLHTLFATFLI